MEDYTPTNRERTQGKRPMRVSGQSLRFEVQRPVRLSRESTRRIRKASR